MKCNLKNLFLLLVLGHSTAQAGQHVGNGGNLDILEFKGITQLAITFVESNKDILRVDGREFNSAVAKTELISSDQESEMAPPLQHVDKNIYSLNTKRWARMAGAEKRSTALNFYLTRVREISQPATPFPPDAEIFAVEFYNVQKHFLDSLMRGEFPNTATQVKMPLLTKALDDTWIVAVDECILNGQEKTGINYPDRNLILLNIKTWKNSNVQHASFLRQTAIALHEYMGISDQVENDYRVSSTWLAELNTLPRFPNPRKPQVKDAIAIGSSENWLCRNSVEGAQFAVSLSQVSMKDLSVQQKKLLSALNNGTFWKLTIQGIPGAVPNLDKIVLTQTLSLAGVPHLQGVIRHQGFLPEELTAQLEDSSVSINSSFLLTIDRDSDSKSFLGNAVLDFQQPKWNLVGPVLMKCFRP